MKNFQYKMFISNAYGVYMKSLFKCLVGMRRSYGKITNQPPPFMKIHQRLKAISIEDGNLMSNFGI